jgi:DMSO/TMAO reductase YedYZ molybdopterin-dependent catalytic subunit
MKITQTPFWQGGKTMYRKTILIVVAILALIVAGVVALNIYSNNNPKPDLVSEATMDRYQENEIREYKGANLDPAIGPRDNSIKGVQYVDIGSYRLKITGLVDRQKELAYEDVLELDAYERKITLYCVEGWDATVLWRGVLLKDIMDLAGVDDQANTVIFHSVDGYTTSLPLETVLTKELILAYNANGLPLPPELGFPFMVVAEDKLGYKWARWVNEIEVSDDPSYLGYWEQRGYNNDATVLP